ncbi:MAG: HAMP domain-containing histidine kinase [Bacteroidetes bacterium]|nr:HAMP domain-containing histidine kinase [Bacteroidota bacterium]
MLVIQVIEREKEQLNTYSKVYRHYILSNDINEALFFLEVITPTLYLPLIITDLDDEPIQDYHSFTLNIDELNNLNTMEEQREYLLSMIKNMKANYEPIIVADDDGNPITKFYYNHSRLVDLLRFFPLITVLVVLSIVMFAYIAFNASKNNEQSRVWVGMSKETAHQLGTPISSLLAWVELLKMNKESPEAIINTADEIGNDIERLDIIARRFSKIGSAPDLKPLNISNKIDEVVAYYERRLPNLSGKIEIHKDYPDNIIINANDMLIGWVLENLIKNAVEAMEGNKGDLYLKVEWAGKKQKNISEKLNDVSEINANFTNVSNKKIQILITDTGKGMTSKMRYKIFKPGFTTKKRGWGMGLSLVRRIIEDYHYGKIYVKNTAIGKGTTFLIEIPIKK